MININRALSNTAVLLPLTGLRKEQFKELSIAFDRELKRQKKAENRNRTRKRERAEGGGRPPSLETSDEKLFFILLYLRVYPTMEVAAFLFDVVKGSIWTWVHHLQPVLEKTLGQTQDLPKRQIRSVKEFMEKFPDVERVIIDGTERPVNRPKDPEKRKTQYSGKKKRHTRKNTIVTNETGKRILCLGYTADGSVHDKKDLTTTGFIDGIPPDIPIDVDLGYKGLENEDDRIHIPTRKPRNGELTSPQKEANKTISSRRVVIEHKIGHVKRYRCVSDVYRNRRPMFDDAIMLTCCGLSNLYHRTRPLATA